MRVLADASRTLLLTVVLLLPAALAAAPMPEAFDLDVGSVARGMQGYGVTAGPEDALVRFPVEVLAVQQDAGPGFPLVLVRASGPFIEASGGVSAGMSGSPVYLGTQRGDGLLGAIAYVFPSASHELALVTPIAAMRSGLAAPESAVSDDGRLRVHFGPLGDAVPVATPVLMTGMDARAAALVDALFDGTSMEPMHVLDGAPGLGSVLDGAAADPDAGAAAAADPQAGVPDPDAGAAAEAADATALRPGSAMSVQLVRGDVTIAAVGTVTTVDGDHVLALGHPLLAGGDVAFALAGADVTAMVPSDVVPFKLANVGRTPLGVVLQDRPAGIAATLGQDPGLVPVALHVNAPDGTHDFAFEVVADERLYPQLTAAVTLELVDRVLAATTGGTADLAWQLELDGGTRLNLSDQADDADDIATAIARAAGSPLQLLAVNPFAPARLGSVELSVRVTTQRRTLEVQEVVAENTDLASGEPLVVHVRLQPYREGAVVKTLTIPFPEDLSGEVEVTIRGGGEPREDGEDDDSDTRDDAGARPRSFPELLDAMRAHPQASELVAEVEGTDGRPLRLARLPLERVVTGLETLEVKIATPDEPADDDSSDTTNDDVNDTRNGNDTANDTTAGEPPTAPGPDGGEHGE